MLLFQMGSGVKIARRRLLGVLRLGAAFSGLNGATKSGAKAPHSKERLLLKRRR
jgi:hypothetical protein